MSWHLTVGPPGSGRTTAMVAVARAACQAGRRVWYVGLPAQRAYITRRITDDGFTALGLEVMSAQQMYYRLLTGGGSVAVKPLVIGNGRLVRVAEALSRVMGALPSPGEARLFAAAIAEAKRFAVTPELLVAGAGDDSERTRLVDVYQAYEGSMVGSWDYDDVRLAAVAMTEQAPVDAAARAAIEAVPADVIIVDGLREVGPLEVRALKALARWREVHLTLPAAPPGEPPTTLLVAGPAPRVDRFLAPNPVAEARWVMRSLKRDLAEAGLDPLALAVVAPPGRAAAVVALADEYGVPIMDETPIALAATAAGRTLLDLLELAESPTSSRLLAVPELAPLAAAALERGVSGQDAIGLLAHESGRWRQWREWRERLTVQGDPVEWARHLVTEVLTLAQPDLPDGFEAKVLSMAQEAARLGSGEGFQRWWGALLSAARHGRRQPGGVALLDATLMSGRRFEKVYLLGAVEGAYGAFEREDYFTPEELRTGADANFGLPLRLQGRDAEVVAELLSRAPHVVVTAPAADRSGLLVADLALLGEKPGDLPDIPAGSRLELPESQPFQPPYDALDLGEPTAEFLRYYRDCALKAWGHRNLPRRDRMRQEETPGWLALRRAMLREPRMTAELLELLALDYPEAATWLSEHREKLLALHFGQRFKDVRNDVVATIHAGERVPDGGGAPNGGQAPNGGRAPNVGQAPNSVSAPGGGSPPTSPAGNPSADKVVIYRFVEPNPAADWRWAMEQLRDRWSEYLAAEVVLRNPDRAPAFVEFVVWPVYGVPIVVESTLKRYARSRMQSRSSEVRAQARRFATGDVTPTPGYACRDCQFFQVCRVKETA